MTSGFFASAPDSKRSNRIAARALLGTATLALLVSSAAVPAFAIPGNQDTVVANVNVSSTITLNVSTDSFNLNGAPNSTVGQTGAVTGVVTTNNVTGYSIGVVASAATLQHTLNGNPDSIPIDALEVADSAGLYTSLSNDSAAPVITNTKATRSVLDGDSFSDDYQVNIPDVNSDTYRVTLNYTATALA